MSKIDNYLQSLDNTKKARIQGYIDHSNNWLAGNRTNYNPITLGRVVKRLLAGGGLLSIESDAKTAKGSKNGYLTGILYLAPHKITGFNICPFAKTCIKDCLFNAGRGRFANITEARIIKTLAWLLDPSYFRASLDRDITKLIKTAKAKSMIPVVRLNGTSDILVERAFIDLLTKYKDLQFYDYTKNPNRFKALPANYDLTFSFDGINTEACKDILNNGTGRVAVVFKDQLPSTFLGYPVIDGDDSDLRFLDGQGVVVGLVAKGDAKKDSANDLFVVDLTQDNRCGLA